MEIININKYNNLYRNKVSNNLRTQAPYQIYFSPDSFIPYGFSSIPGSYNERFVTINFIPGSQKSVVLIPTIVNLKYIHGTNSSVPPAFSLDKVSVEFIDGKFNSQDLGISIVFPLKDVEFDFTLRLEDKVNGINWDMECQGIGDVSLHGNCHITILNSFNNSPISPTRGVQCSLPPQSFCNLQFYAIANDTGFPCDEQSLEYWNWFMIVFYNKSSYNSFYKFNPGKISIGNGNSIYEINNKFSLPKFLPYKRDSNNFIEGRIFVDAHDVTYDNKSRWHFADIKIDYQPNISPVIRNVRNLKYDKLFTTS